MKFGRLLLAIILSILSFNLANSQGDYLMRDSSGSEINAGYSSNHLGSAYAFGIGYSSSGVLDVAAAYALQSYSHGQKVDILSPSLAIHWLKTEDFPLASAILMTYERFFYRGGGTGDIYGAGGAVYSKIKLNRNISIEPMGSILFVVDSPVDISVYETIVSFDLSWFFKLSPRSIMRIVPGISHVEDITTVSISVGFIMPVGK